MGVAERPNLASVLIEIGQLFGPPAGKFRRDELENRLWENGAGIGRFCRSGTGDRQHDDRNRQKLKTSPDSLGI